MFKLRPLPYAFDALEPYISARVMQIHYEKHHQAYVNKLNKALENHPQFYNESLEWLLASPDQLPESIKTAVMRNAGGDYNHMFFWAVMKKDGGGEPNGQLAIAIKKYFGSFDAFREQFSTVANGVFGSGWAWLCFTRDGDLEIRESANQDSPLTYGAQVILGLDIWEHAYYLQYENRRSEYVTNWWNIVNWAQVEENYRMMVE